MGSVVVLDAKIINDVFIAIWCHGTVMLLTFDDLFVKQRRCYSVRCFYAGLVMTSKATTGCNYYNTIISNRTSILSTIPIRWLGAIFLANFWDVCCGVKMLIFYVGFLVAREAFQFLQEIWLRSVEFHSITLNIAMRTVGFSVCKRSDLGQWSTSLPTRIAGTSRI